MHGATVAKGDLIGDPVALPERFDVVAQRLGLAAKQVAVMALAPPVGDVSGIKMQFYHPMAFVLQALGQARVKGRANAL